MKYIVSIILTPIFYISFVILLLVFHPIQFVCLRLFGYSAHKTSVDLLNWFLMQCMRIMGAKIAFINFEDLPDDIPKIFVCNHQSMWDISPLIWKLKSYHMKFISKKELARNIPSVSFNLKYGGSVTIDRSNPIEAKNKIKNFAKNIKLNNYSVCIFPEGSRSRNGKLKPFKIGGIQSMLEIMPNALIIPIAIKNTAKFDNGGKFLKNPFITVEFTMLRSIMIENSKIESQIELIRKDIEQILNT